MTHINNSQITADKNYDLINENNKMYMILESMSGVISELSSQLGEISTNRHLKHKLDLINYGTQFIHQSVRESAKYNTNIKLLKRTINISKKY